MEFILNSIFAGANPAFMIQVFVSNFLNAVVIYGTWMLLVVFLKIIDKALN